MNNSGSVSQTTSGIVGASKTPLNFEGISKLFSQPLADAANTLGVCTSVLKKICRDNGVARWPYRKFLAGKTVEDILKDAARERKRELVELSKVSRGHQHQTNTSNSMNTTQANGLQQRGGNRLLPNTSPHHKHPSGTARFQAYVDEFKHGFPPNGLSTVSNRWWGTSNCDDTEDEAFEGETNELELEKQRSHEFGDNNQGTVFEAEPNPRPDKSAVSSEGGTTLLLSLRERAVSEGREALQLGVHKGYHEVFKLRRRERKVLLRVFKSSLPYKWKFDLESSLFLH